MWTSNQSVLSHADIKLKSRQCCIMWTSHLQSRRCYITLTSQLLSRQCCIKLQSRQRCIVLTSNLQSRQCCIMSTPSFSQDRGSPGWPIIALCDCVFIAHGLHWNDTACTIYFIHPNAAITHVGDSGGVVNSLEFCQAFWLLLLPVRTFFTMEGGDSEYANFTLPTLKAFFEARSHNVSGNKQCFGMSKTHFFYEVTIFWSAQKRRRDTFCSPSIPFPW